MKTIHTQYNANIPKKKALKNFNDKKSDQINVSDRN